MSLQLNFSDQLVLIDLTEYDEASLLNHIKACHTIVEQVPSHFDISRRDEERDAASQKSQKFQITGLMKEIDADSSCIPSPFIELSPAVVDSVRSACFLSAKYAVVQTVQRIGYSVQSLVDLLFQEGPGNSWIGSAHIDHSQKISIKN